MARRCVLFAVERDRDRAAGTCYQPEAIISLHLVQPVLHSLGHVNVDEVSLRGLNHDRAGNLRPQRRRVVVGDRAFGPRTGHFVHVESAGRGHAVDVQPHGCLVDVRAGQARWQRGQVVANVAVYPRPNHVHRRLSAEVVGW